MISEGRYGYHLQDIAEIEAMPKPISSVHQMRLEMMKREVAEYEAVCSNKAKHEDGPCDCLCHDFPGTIHCLPCCKYTYQPRNKEA